jgi:hypothetical protein
MRAFLGYRGVVDHQDGGYTVNGRFVIARHRRVGQGRELVGGYFRFDLAK